MHRKRNQGSFTVYFVLIVTAALSLFLILLWAVRQWIGHNDAVRATQTAGQSVLSSYHGELADRYGLYGTSTEKLQQRLENWIEADILFPTERLYQQPAYLLSPQKLWNGIFHYELQSVEVFGIESLREPEVLRLQVENFMKYRIAQEGMEILMEQLGMIRQSSEGAGLQAQYAGIQRVLGDYNSYYGQLIRLLYPEGGAVYVTMTQEEEYRPQRLLDAARSMRDRVTDEAVETLALWQEKGYELMGKNQEALSCLGQLEEILEGLRKRITQWENTLPQLSEERRNEESVQKMIQEVSRVRKELWGLHDEIPRLRQTLKKNQMVTEPLEASTQRILGQLNTSKNADENALAQMETAAERFLQYNGAIELQYEKNEGNGKIEFGRLWKWLKKWKIDLKKYGEDTMLFEGGTEYLEEEDLEKALSQSMEAVEGGSGQGIIEKLLLVEYAVGMFQSLEDQVHREDGKTVQNLRGKNYGEGIFRNETEYLIQGSANEYDNLRSVEMQILGIRMIMNIAYLASSSEKQSVLQSAAAGIGGIIAPGIGTTVIYGALMFLWSAAESYVDYAALVQGDRVPIFKTEASWRTDLESILAEAANVVEGEKGREEEGADYEMYLRMLLLMQNTDTLLERIGSVIQLNLHKNDRDFLLTDMATAFEVRTVLRGWDGTYGAKAFLEYR